MLLFSLWQHCRTSYLDDAIMCRRQRLVSFWDSLSVQELRYKTGKSSFSEKALLGTAFNRRIF